MRIDIHLASLLGVSRAQAQKIIKAGTVTVNGSVATPHTPVNEGDVLVYPKADGAKGERRKAKAGGNEERIPLPVLFENDDVVVVDKPAGMIVHPVNETDPRQSVVGSLRRGRRGLARVGDNPLRPGVVHRLDKDVSGVMIVAKTNAAFEDLKRQFAGREVEKEYVALVYGRMSRDHGTIDFKIARSKTLGRMVSRPEGQEGKEALTEYDVLDRFKTCTLVKVRIHTGRTHQIRAHFKAIGHPVVGDTLYRTKIVNIRPVDMSRLFLHARRLCVTLPDGTRAAFESPLPDGLAAMLATLPRT